MTRLLEDEENLVDDETEYSRSNTSWGTLHDYGNVTLDEDGILVVSFQAYRTGSWIGYIRLKCGGSLYIFGGQPAVSYTYYGCAVWLAAGTYNLLMEGKTSAGGTVYVKTFQAGTVFFSDTTGNANVSYAAGLETEVDARKLAVGTIAYNILAINVFANTSGAQTNFEDVGGAETNGVSVFVDGVQQDWNEKNQDADSYEAASGKCYVAVATGETHTVTIVKDNANTAVHISVIASPWILPYALSEIISSGFTSGSTFYLVAEPLWENVTKFLRIGKTRAASFGDDSDYYHADSGADIKEFSYTYEKLEPEDIPILVSGIGGCISAIGADFR